jgi:nucleotide-binding universal stress UspA family protein
MNDQDDQSHGVVVGYDGSPSVRLALEWAAETARQLGTRRTIVHSLSLSMIPVSLPSTSRWPSRCCTRPPRWSAARADHASSVLEASQIEAQYLLGSPAGQLVDASRDADLIVLGSRGHGRLRAGLLGSTSYAVTAHARCPVVLVRAGAEQQEEEQEEMAGDLHVARPGPGHPVIVGVDDSEAAQRALDAAAWAEREHAALHVVASAACSWVR